jgi:hypothetical protein
MCFRVSSPNTFTGDQPKYETFKLNSPFQLSKLTRYDQKLIQTKANYQIVSNDLMTYLGQDAYIKLNFFEKFGIMYAKKEDIFHKMNLTQKLLTLLLYCVLMKMRSNFFLDAVMLSGTEANNSQTCSVEV